MNIMNVPNISLIVALLCGGFLVLIVGAAAVFFIVRSLNSKK